MHIGLDIVFNDTGFKGFEVDVKLGVFKILVKCVYATHGNTNGPGFAGAIRV